MSAPRSPRWTPRPPRTNAAGQVVERTPGHPETRAVVPVSRVKAWAPGAARGRDPGSVPYATRVADADRAFRALAEVRARCWLSERQSFFERLRDRAATLTERRLHAPPSLAETLLRMTPADVFEAAREVLEAMDAREHTPPPAYRCRR